MNESAYNFLFNPSAQAPQAVPGPVQGVAGQFAPGGAVAWQNMWKALTAQGMSGEQAAATLAPYTTENGDFTVAPEQVWAEITKAQAPKNIPMPDLFGPAKDVQ